MRNDHRPQRGTAQDAALRDELKEACAERDAAFARFNAASEPELIDAAVYEINAAQSRYDYLHRVMRERGGAAAFHAESASEGGV